jgi:hypothetical protein
MPRRKTEGWELLKNKIFMILKLHQLLLKAQMKEYMIGETQSTYG